MQVPKGRDQVSGGVSVPCQHATPVADAPWKPIISNVKFSKKSNLGQGHELVVSSKIEVPRDVRNSKDPYTWQVQKRMVSTLEQMQVPNWTGPGVRRSKRLLLASRTRCNALWKPPKFGNKVKIGIKVQFGNKFANWCNVWSIEGVIVYGPRMSCNIWERETS